MAAVWLALWAAVDAVCAEHLRRQRAGRVCTAEANTRCYRVSCRDRCQRTLLGWVELDG